MINSKKYWDSRFSSDWESANGPRQSRFFAELTINHLPSWLIDQIKRMSLTLADWGCAQGDGTDVWVSYIGAQNLVGVDFSPVAVDQAAQRHPAIRFINEDWIAEAQNNIEAFDFVFSSNTLEHFYKPYDVLGTLCQKAKKGIILTLPYQEMDRIDEHFFSFLPENLPLVLPNGFRLVWSQVIDCRRLPNSFWQGYQITLVYADTKWFDTLKLTLSDCFIGQDDTTTQINQLNAFLEESEKQTAILIQKTADRDEQIASLSETLADRDEQIASLSETLADRDEQIATLSETLADRDGKISSLQVLTTQISEKDEALQLMTTQMIEKDAVLASLTAQVDEKDLKIQELMAEIYRITNSTGWSLLKVLWRMRLFIAPHGSRREQFFRFGMRQIRSLMRLRFFTKPIGVPLNKHQKESADSPETFQNISRHLIESKVDLPTFKASTSYDILCFPIIDWEHRFQRPQQLCTLFAKHGHRVFYLKMTFYEQGSEPIIRELADNIYQVELPGPADLNRFLQSIPAEAVEKCLTALESLFTQAKITDAICLTEIPFWIDLVLRLRERYGWKILFDCMDEQMGLTLLNADLAPREGELVQKANLLIVSSQKLWEKYSGKANLAMLLPNATDFQHFNQPKTERFLEHLAHPIIGYYGAIMDWLDAETLSEVAVSRPDWNFVLIGNLDTDVGRLSNLPNVHFLGEQPYSRLPAYLQAFDVCLIPFKLTPIIEATNPVKFYEYLSAGKPVVSSRLPDLATLTDLFYPAGDASEFANQIENALHEDALTMRPKRIEWASRQTWQHRFELLNTKINTLYGLASIIIVSYNNREKIQACLESIACNTFYPRYEVIIIDNGSTPDVVEYLHHVERMDRRVRLIPNRENLGFARGVNLGIKEKNSESEFLFLLNNDTIVTPGWLNTLVHWLRDPTIGLVGPVTGPSGAANEAAIPVSYSDLDELNSFALEYAAQHRGVSFDIHMLAMYCVGMRCQVFNEIGWLDDQFEVGMFEDDDYSLRVRKHGYRVVCVEDVFIHHFGRSSFSAIDDQKYQILFNTNRQRFENKWGIKWSSHKGRKPR